MEEFYVKQKLPSYDLIQFVDWLEYVRVMHDYAIVETCINYENIAPEERMLHEEQELFFSNFRDKKVESLNIDINGEGLVKALAWLVASNEAIWFSSIEESSHWGEWGNWGWLFLHTSSKFVSICQINPLRKSRQCMNTGHEDYISKLIKLLASASLQFYNVEDYDKFRYLCNQKESEIEKIVLEYQCDFFKELYSTLEEMEGRAMRRLDQVNDIIESRFKMNVDEPKPKIEDDLPF